MIWDKAIKKRIIGLHGDIMSENLLIALACIHGNETSGILALNRVFDELKKQIFPTNGCLLALKGNLAAIEKKTRFIDCDLNRLWSPNQIDYVRNIDINQLTIHEHREQKELLYILEQFTIHREKSEPFLFLDLHTTSAQGGLFTIVNGNDISVKMARKLEVPLILNLQKVITNTTLSIFSRKEFSAIAFEAGQHDDPMSIDRMEAAIKILLHDLDIVRYPRLLIEKARAKLVELTHNLPKVLEFSYKHTIKPGEEFEMIPGFQNFDPIKSGQILAHDKYGPIKAKHDGYIMMPLYQKQGEDGFFVVTESSIQ